MRYRIPNVVRELSAQCRTLFRAIEGAEWWAATLPMDVKIGNTPVETSVDSANRTWEHYRFHVHLGCERRIRGVVRWRRDNQYGDQWVVVSVEAQARSAAMGVYSPVLVLSKEGIEVIHGAQGALRTVGLLADQSW